MKAVLVVCLVVFSLFMAKVSKAESTTLFLNQKTVVKAGDTVITLRIRAYNSEKLDIAALQGIVKTPLWLSLKSLVPLKADGSKNDDMSSSLGAEKEVAGQKAKSALMYATDIVPKVQDTVQLADLILNVTGGHKVALGEMIDFTVEEIALSNFAGGKINCNSPITLHIVVGKADTVKNPVDTVSTDTSAKSKLKLSFVPGNDDQGYVYYMEKQKKVLLDAVLEFKTAISQLQFTITAPDPTWVLQAPVTVENNQSVMVENLGNGKYKVLFTGDLLTNANNPRRSILHLSFLLDAKTPFDDKKFVVSEITASPKLTTDKIKINTDTSVVLNLNKLFGVKLGRKGDVDFPTEWNFGNGVVDYRDVDMTTRNVLGTLLFNSYQRWAADMNSDGEVDSDDLILLQAATSVNEIIIDGEKLDVRVSDSQLMVRSPRPIAGELVIYSLNGSEVLRSLDVNRPIGISNLTDGVYFYQLTVFSANAGKQEQTGKIIMY